MLRSYPNTALESDAPNSFDAILSRVKELLPELKTRSSEIEANRRLPRDIVESLRRAGVFRSATPKEWGGPELTSMQQAELIETIATADASAAWCCMIGMDSGIYSGFLSVDVAHQVYPSLDLATSGWIHPQGRAKRVPGGYLVTGKWRFGSGVTHCDVLSAGCLVYEDDSDESISREKMLANWRVMLCDPSDFIIEDTWHTTGLSGSGSLDYSTEGLFVPEERSFSFSKPHRKGPLHDAPDAILRKMSGVPLGMARACLDYLREQARWRNDRETGARWTDDPRIQTEIARCEMEFAAARITVYSSLTTQWEKLSRGETFSVDDRVATALARYNAFQMGRKVARKAYDLLGGASVYRNTSPLDRWVRDAETMCQHAVAQDSILQSTGKVLLGGASGSPFF